MTQYDEKYAIELYKQLKGKSVYEKIYYLLDQFGDRIALASSMGAEDQVLTDIVLSHKRQARIFVIDTRMLNDETYELIKKSEQHYGITYEIYEPEAAQIEKLEAENGKELMYESIEKRKLCCQVRKIEPLQRALSTVDVWITGLRRDQSVTRSLINDIEWDSANGLLKINPLADWSELAVWDYIRLHEVPYNELHDKDYPSIGCAPCTRAVKPGENIRAGRWWWEDPEHKECGLHKQVTVGSQRR